MTRTQFDRKDVVDKLTLLFWINGYSATSMKQVVDATGLKPGSLYLSFGNKEALFQESLRNYADNGIKRIRKTLNSQPDYKAGICKILEKMVADSTKRNFRSCFLVKTQLELAGEANALFEFAAARLGEIERIYQGYLETEFSEPVSQRRAASIMLHISGILVWGYQRGSAERILEGLREGLPWLPWD